MQILLLFWGEKETIANSWQTRRPQSEPNATAELNELFIQSVVLTVQSCSNTTVSHRRESATKNGVRFEADALFRGRFARKPPVGRPKSNKHFKGRLALTQECLSYANGERAPQQLSRYEERPLSTIKNPLSIRENVARKLTSDQIFRDFLGGHFHGAASFYCDTVNYHRADTARFSCSVNPHLTQKPGTTEFRHQTRNACVYQSRVIINMCPFSPSTAPVYAGAVIYVVVCEFNLFLSVFPVTEYEIRIRKQMTCYAFVTFATCSTNLDI